LVTVKFLDRKSPGGTNGPLRRIISNGRAIAATAPTAKLPSFAAVGALSTLAYLGLLWLLRSWAFHPRRTDPNGRRT
jgi:hypothetical protein